MTRRGEPYFFYMALVLIAIVLAGFVPFGFAKPGGPLATPLLLHVHGAFFLGWFILLATQARLAGSGNIALHMRLGKLSLFWALAMVVMGYLVTRHAYARPDWTIAGLPPAQSAIFPFTDIVNFIIVYSLGLANRKTPATHKRFMLLAGILIIDAAVARLMFTLGLLGPLILVLELTLVLSLIVYDLMTLKRPHWASLLGLALFIAANAVKMNIASIGWWPGFVEKVFG